MTSKTNKPTQATQQKNICLLVNGREAVDEKRTIVVLGVERGGTSMAAGILRALGINMGEFAGLNHEDPMFLVEEYDQLQLRIVNRDRDHDVWGFKVPKASLHLDFYEKNLRNPYYVVVYRNSLSIVDSRMQRGAGTAVDLLDRIATYHAAILDLIKTSKAPILLLNYERAVTDDATKEQVVEEMARFAGVALSDELLERASSMMTGDGKGYVNLPEHFFLAEPRSHVGARTEIALKELEPESRDGDGWVNHDMRGPTIRYALASGENLPTAFWLELDIKTEGMDLKTNPLRVYFNFTGQYFPGHCARPKIEQGRNLFWIETSGNAADFAFGSITVPVRMNITARAYAAEPGDAPSEAAQAAGSSTPMPPDRPSLLRRVVRKVRG